MEEDVESLAERPDLVEWRGGDVDNAKNDGLIKIKTYTDGKIELTDIDAS